MPANRLMAGRDFLRVARGLVLRFSPLQNDRRGKLVLAFLFVFVVLLQAALHLPATDRGRPYENWDEISVYNTSFVMSGPATQRVWHYGSLDGLLQWVATVEYLFYDPVGRDYSHLRYANNIPASWNDPLYAVHRVFQPGRIDYNYFRGTDDHAPLFNSRRIHLLFGYAVVLTIGLALIAALGPNAILVLAPLLAMTAAPSVYFMMTQSLPNAINAMLAFGAVLLSMLYADRGKLRYLLFAIAILAVAMNFKPDVIIMVGAPALSLCVIALRRGMRSALVDAGWGIIVGLGVTCIAHPALVIDPIGNIRTWLYMLLEGGIGGSPSANWAAFLAFLSESFLWASAPGLVSLLVVLAVLAAASVLVLRDVKGRASVLLAALVPAIVCWTVIVMRSRFNISHYFFNGYAAIMALAAMMALIAWEVGGVWRRLAGAMTAAFASIWISHAVAGSLESQALKQKLAAHAGLDPAHTRNLASLAAIDFLSKSEYAPTVLVDQHAYIDLRPFRLRGYEARYINLDNFDAVAAGLDRKKPYIVIFARGGFDRGDGHLLFWEGDWTPPMMEAYRTYQARLLQLPLLRRFGDDLQPVLSGAPIRENDEIRVSTLPVLATIGR